MSRSVKLDNLPTKVSAMEDYRCWAQIASEFILEIREHIATGTVTASDQQMLNRIDHFLLHDKLPPRSN